ncbi:MAG TPA: prolyl oligopeptidase family serine peptidase [Gammaproteobacteria bacterium]|nr:prolyl oligopeptidase family serine peptidase [Gammaproteobacteria bacterium]
MTKLLVPACVALLAVTVAGCASTFASRTNTNTNVAKATMNYPEARRSDHVDTYFGTEVHDPYRWMEDVDSPEVQQWVAAENAVTQPYLDQLAGQDWLKQRLTELWQYERWGVPIERGGKYFYTHNDGLQDQSVLFVADDLGQAGRVLIDPNHFRADATNSLARWTPSWDGTLLAYAVSNGGSDWTTLHVRNVETGKDLPDVIDYTKFTSAAWTHDNSGFYYSRYPSDGEGRADDSKPVSIYYHALGTPQSEDRQVYALPETPERNPYATVTEDGDYLIINVEHGYNANAVYYKKLGEADAQVVRLLDDWDALYTFIGNDGAVFYFATTNDAPRGRVIAVDIRSPDPKHWRTIIPEQAETLSSVHFTGGMFFAEYLKDAHSLVRVYNHYGDHVRDVDLPGLGSAGGFAGPSDATQTFYAYTSFTTPPAIYRYDIASGKSDIYRDTKVPVDDLNSFEVEQVFYTSKDGTRVPMFIVHRKGLKLDGNNPTLLYGYGGFDISLTPYYSPARMAWLEMGGVFAMANLRGGGEYGEAWHLAGTRLNKQNVFDDFIYAAKYLESHGYTRPDKLAIHGASNGGLLIGAVLTQQPQLFGAALPAVGVMDMLRYQTANANAAGWASDYGTSHDSKAMFEALYAYSPVHNAEPGTCYPPTLITTADHDNRVAPWNSFKFAAAMQHAQSCDNPMLIRIETRAGHGAGKPTWMVIEEIADQYAFLVHALDMPVPGEKD